MQLEVTINEIENRLLFERGRNMTNVICPLCSKSNNCCNGLDKSLGVCWCNQEVFPAEIFEQVPPEQLRKACICKSCLEQYSEQLERNR
ncbi:cysteine-rich CWC family protein [Sporosarcina sp. FSL K6-1522]|uniref:cysteine-rich CWC family protein n=1 Tax=Sporosarcina sp. FSL K6-1522 TaxID=2921554 RepID=UPI00315B1D28